MKTYGVSPSAPPVDETASVGATVSCGHYTCVLRCYRAQLTAIGGLPCDPPVDAQLQLAVERGHKWYVLSDKCPSDEQVRLSKWKNQDQNSSQVQHEIELIREIQWV